MVNCGDGNPKSSLPAIVPHTIHLIYLNIDNAIAIQLITARSEGRFTTITARIEERTHLF
jgi:hypothetical protein